MKVSVFYSALVLLFTFSLVSFSDEVEIYKNALIVKQEVNSNIILVPVEATEILTSEPILVLERYQTNIVKSEEDLKKYSKITNEIEKLVDSIFSKNLELQNILQMISFSLEVSKNLKDLDKALESHKKLLSQKSSVIIELATLSNRLLSLKKESNEIFNRIKNNSMDMYVYFLKENLKGTISFVLPCKTSIFHEFNVDTKVISSFVYIDLNSKFEISSSKTKISTISLTPQIVDTTLPRIFGKVSEKVYGAKIAETSIKKKSFVPEDIIPSEYEKMEEPKVEEIPSDVNITFVLNEPVTIKDDSKVKIIEFPVESITEVLAIPKKLNKGIVVFSISNTSKYSILPGDIEIVDKSGRTKGLKITQVIPPNGIFKTHGISSEVVTVTKILTKSFTESPKFFKKSYRETKEYKITVKNNSKLSQKVNLIELIPIPADDRIKIDFSMNALAKNEEIEKVKKEGKVEILLELKPNEEKEVVYSYSVEYPEDLYYYEYESYY